MIRCLSIFLVLSVSLFRLITTEEVSKGLFARVCVEVDVSKPLKKKTKYVQAGVFYDLSFGL